MEAVLARGAQLLLALAGAYAIALWWASIVWTFRDIESRSRNIVTQVVSTLMAVVFPFVGLPLYLILRPKETLDAAFQRSLEEEYILQDLEELPLCPECQHYVHDDFVLCPHCHARLRDECGACGRLVDLRWALCPYCGVVQQDKDEATPRVEEPAPRWTAPNLRRRRGLPPSVQEQGVASAPEPAGVSAPSEADRIGPAVAAATARADEQDDEDPTPFTVVVGAKSLGERFDRLRSNPSIRRSGLMREGSDRLILGTKGSSSSEEDLALQSNTNPNDGQPGGETRKTPRFARLTTTPTSGGIVGSGSGPTSLSADDVPPPIGADDGATNLLSAVAAGRRPKGD